MLLARMIAPIHSLGPGRRLGIWFQGCSKRCKECISPEMQIFDKSKEVPVDMMVMLIKQEAERNNCHRLTISGGDPFEQPHELYKLLRGVRHFFKDILVYTGFTLDEIIKKKNLSRCLKYIDVLVDGRYIAEENSGVSRLYGSCNQKIHFFNNVLATEYKEYEEQNGMLESFIHKEKVIIVGIQRRD